MDVKKAVKDAKVEKLTLELIKKGISMQEFGKG